MSKIDESEVDECLKGVVEVHKKRLKTFFDSFADYNPVIYRVQAFHDPLDGNYLHMRLSFTYREVFFEITGQGDAPACLGVNDADILFFGWKVTPDNTKYNYSTYDKGTLELRFDRIMKGDADPSLVYQNTFKRVLMKMCDLTNEMLFLSNLDF